ncbi:MAG: hypothetical protein HC922_04025 [Leptolyngbyaceae cyanobacterium SM2_3_12]|nr:hypothetical protein [Leptolyngbyaceae cyanobacterium SM2_3_12]
MASFRRELGQIPSPAWPSSETQGEVLEQSYTEAIAAFDPQQAETLETTYGMARSEADQLLGSLPQQQALLAEYNQQMAGLEAIAQQQDEAQKQLQSKEKIKRFVNFARKAYNEAGPRITEQYVRSVSHQADRLFRDLLNRPNVALQWTRDYDILVQDGPNQRRLATCLGGNKCVRRWRCGWPC